MRSPTVVLVVASCVLFIAPPLAVVTLDACSPSGAHDAGTSSDGSDGNEETGPCHDGTIEFASCLVSSDGAPATERFTDEACDGLDTAESRGAVHADDTLAPAIVAPAEAATVAADVPFTFSWRASSLAVIAPVHVTPRPFAWTDDVTRFAQFLPSAEAHCAAFGGVGYEVIVKSGGQILFRAETAATSYTPTADGWARIRAGRGTLELTVRAAQFNANDVTSGPYEQTSPRHFTLGQ